MNMYIVAAGCLLVILMVMFGRNPIEEAREERARLGSTDPLIHATDQYFKEQHYPQGMGLSSVGDSSGGVNLAAPGAGMGAGGYPAPQPYQQVPYQAQQGGYSQGAYQPQQDYPQNQAQQDTGSYYPPPAPGARPSPLQGQR